MSVAVSPVIISVAGAAAVRPLQAGDALRLYGATSGHVGFVPASIAGSATYTLPSADAVGVLTSNGSGTLSWAAAAGGGITIDTTAITSGGANRILFESATNKVSESANLTFGTTNTGLAITAGAATTIPLVVKGATSQSANLTDWRDSSGASMAYAKIVSATGYLGARRLEFTDDASNRYITSSLWQSNIGVSISASTIWMQAGSDQNQFWFFTSYGVMCGAVFGAGTKNYTIRGYDQDGVGGRGVCTLTVRAGNAFQANTAGAAMLIAGGAGTGTGAGGAVTIQTAPAGASGSALNALATAAQFDASATAGNTRLLLYDVDNATLERVTVGAADSGGVGYKVLRIPN